MNDSTQKQCKVCGLVKSLDDYYIREGRHQPRCKACIQAQNRAYRDAHPEVGKAASTRWQRRNKDRVRAKNIEWYHANKERAQLRYKKWVAENAEARRTYMADWLAANPHQGRSDQARRRARKKATAVGPVDLAALWEEQDGFCALCNEPIDATLAYPDPMSKSVDHIIPLSKGGPHVQENLQWVHLVGNLRKSARMPE